MNMWKIHQRVCESTETQKSIVCLASGTQGDDLSIRDRLKYEGMV